MTSERIARIPSNNAVVPNLNVVADAFQLTQTSRAHEVSLEFKKEVLQPTLDTYWNQVKDVLHPDLIKLAQKGGFRDIRRDRVVDAAGGLSNFYAPVIAEVVEKHLESQPRQALAVINVKMSETLTHYLVMATVYLEPEVKWKKPIPGIDTALVVKVPKVAEDLAERLADQSLDEAAELSGILSPLDQNAVAADGLVGVVDVNSTIDGKPWEEGRAVAKKWLLSKPVFKVPELYDALIGMSQGETKTVDFVLPEIYGGLAGSKVTANVRLIQLYEHKKAAVDDDLAKSNGYDSLTAYRDMFKTKAQENIARGKKAALDTGIYAALLDLDTVEVDAVPYIWMTEKAKEIYGQARSMVETEDQLLEQFKSIKDASGNRVVETKSDALTYLAQQSAQSLITDLVLRSWGKKKGIDGPSKLSDMSEYVSLVRSEIQKVVVQTEIEMGGE